MIASSAGGQTMEKTDEVLDQVLDDRDGTDGQVLD
jgi:hypothetical protein